MKIKSKSKNDLVPARKYKGKKALEAVQLFKGVQNPRQRSFLAAFVETGGVVRASELSGVSWKAHYLWKRDDARYLEEFDRAIDLIADRAEAELYRRAVDGYQKPISYKGIIEDWYTEYSDTCLIFMLKGAKPEKYRDNLVNLSSNAPVAIQINFGAEAKPEKVSTPQDVVIQGSENDSNPTSP
jgi:hypothetical protein